MIQVRILWRSCKNGLFFSYFSLVKGEKMKYQDIGQYTQNRPFNNNEANI